MRKRLKLDVDPVGASAIAPIAEERKRCLLANRKNEDINKGIFARFQIIRFVGEVVELLVLQCHDKRDDGGNRTVPVVPFRQA